MSMDAMWLFCWKAAGADIALGFVCGVMAGETMLPIMPWRHRGEVSDLNHEGEMAAARLIPGCTPGLAAQWATNNRYEPWA